MCFPFYKDLSAIILWAKSGKYLERRYWSTYIIRAYGLRDVYGLRADVSKYRPEVYKSEKSKILKKIHKVALGKLLT